MKTMKRIFGIFALIFLLIVPSAFAELSEDDINAIMRDINSGDVQAVVSIIESGKLDELCLMINGYDKGCSAYENTAIMISGKNYSNAEQMAYEYAAACIIHSASYALLKEYIDSGFMRHIIGEDAERQYQALTEKKEVIQICKQRAKYCRDLSEFRDIFKNVVLSEIKNNSSGSSGGGGSSGGSGRHGICVYEKDGTLPKKIIDNSEYKIKYDCGRREDEVVILAIYDNEQRMTRVEISSTVKGCREISAKLTSNGSIKVFYFDSLENLVPNGACNKLNISKYLTDIKNYEGVVTYLGGERITITQDDGETVNLYADFPVYKYIGHRIKVTSLYEEIYEISDSTEYETAEFKSTDIEYASETEIKANETTYPISQTAVFYGNGSEMTETDFSEDSDYILSKTVGEENWSTVSIFSYRSDIVDYTDGELIRGEINYRGTVMPYTEIFSDGKKISPDEIKVGDVISDCGGYKLYISRKKVCGKASFEDDGITVNGEKFSWYDAARSCESYYDTVTAYIDIFGNAVKVVPDMTSYKLGLVTGIYTEDNSVFIDYRDKNGELIKRRISGDAVADGNIMSAEILSEISNSVPFYGNIPVAEDARVILKTGSRATLKYNAAAGLSSQGIITDENTEFYSLYENECIYYTHEELEKLCSLGSMYDAIVFFDEDNNINPKIVCFTSKLFVQKNMIVTESDGITVSGYVDGEKVTYKLSDALTESGAVPDVNRYLKIEYVKDEIIGYEVISLLDGISYTEVSNYKETFTCGTVIKKGNGYLVFGDSASMYSIVQITANTDFYTYGGDTVEKADINDIIADPRAEYGSRITFMHVNSRGIAETVVVRKL